MINSFVENWGIAALFPIITVAFALLAAAWRFFFK